MYGVSDTGTSKQAPQRFGVCLETRHCGVLPRVARREFGLGTTFGVFGSGAYSRVRCAV